MEVKAVDYFSGRRVDMEMVSVLLSVLCVSGEKQHSSNHLLENVFSTTTTNMKCITDACLRATFTIFVVLQQLQLSVTRISSLLHQRRWKH